jgi:HlyD family secretion protein
MVVRDGRVEARRVEAGIVEGATVEIRDGLAEGETVVARAAAFLRPGDRVRPLPDNVSGG